MAHLAHFLAALFDVDGTLANTEHQITPKTQKALVSLQQAGIITGVCTGRHYAQLGSYVLDNFPTNSLHVVSGGAQVIDQTGHILWEKTLAPTITEQLFAEAKREQLGFFTHYGNYSYATKEVRSWFKQSFVGASSPQDISELPSMSVPIVIVFQPTPSLLVYLSQQTELEYKELISKEHGQYVDITAKGINKSVGLQKWSELQQIPLSKIIGFGDSSNDQEFLESVGWSVAMGNAKESILQLAKRKIGHVDQDGISTYLDNILRGAEL